MTPESSELNDEKQTTTPGPKIPREVLSGRREGIVFAG